MDSSLFAKDCGVKSGMPIMRVMPLIMFNKLDLAPTQPKKQHELMTIQRIKLLDFHNKNIDISNEGGKQSR